MSEFDQQVTFLLVSDLERSTQFYRDLLGLELVLDQGDCRIFGVTNTAFVGVCERTERGDPGSILLTLVTDDVDGQHQSLIGAGAVCEKPPQHNKKYAVYHAFYRDPDGYLVEIQQFLDPAWPAAKAAN
jgi:catechol 2,3-dioxygenase-like lactoylglutathione lyase family enzyme